MLFCFSSRKMKKKKLQKMRGPHCNRNVVRRHSHLLAVALLGWSMDSMHPSTFLPTPFDYSPSPVLSAAFALFHSLLFPFFFVFSTLIKWVFIFLSTSTLSTFIHSTIYHHSTKGNLKKKRKSLPLTHTMTFFFITIMMKLKILLKAVGGEIHEIKGCRVITT